LPFSLLDLLAGFRSHSGNHLRLLLGPSPPKRFILLIDFGTGQIERPFELGFLLVGGFKSALRQLPDAFRLFAAFLQNLRHRLEENLLQIHRQQNKKEDRR